MLPRLQVDKGAIRFILSGANIMCPGLTSAGARMDIDLPEEMIVVSYCSSNITRSYINYILVYYNNSNSYERAWEGSNIIRPTFL